MLIPAPIDMTGVFGASFDQAIQLWADSAETQVFDMTTEYIVSDTELQIDGLETLTPGNGLTINGTSGFIEISMTPEQTALALKPISKWRLKLVKLNGIDSDYPTYGNINWVST